MISETKQIPLWQMKRSVNDVSVWLEPKVTNNASSYYGQNTLQSDDLSHVREVVSTVLRHQERYSSWFLRFFCS